MGREVFDDYGKQPDHIQYTELEFNTRMAEGGIESVEEMIDRIKCEIAYIGITASLCLPDESDSVSWSFNARGYDTDKLPLLQEQLVHAQEMRALHKSSQ